jgi:hypothetical protein
MGIETIIAAVGVGLSAAGTAASTLTATAQTDAQQKAAKQAADAADKQAQLETDQINRANAKSPDTAAIASQNAQAAKGGQAGTLLTGTGGVNPGSLSLGKTTLLGG